MDWQELHSQKQLDELLQSKVKADSPILILKHSGRCMISTTAKKRLERHQDSRLDYFLIDVISKRELSDSLAATTGVRHESPQSFLWIRSELVDVQSHFSISPKGISKLIDDSPLN